MCAHRIEFVLGDVGAVLMRGDGAERVLDLLRRVDVLRLLADHEGHVLLQRHLAIAVGIDHICVRLRLTVVIVHAV